MGRGARALGQKRVIRAFALVSGAVIIGVAAYVALRPAPRLYDAPLVAVTVPELQADAQAGALHYDAHCAACHGRNGAGQDGVGPPLVHIIYETSHHADGAFYAAVQLGVRAHHWSFGDMPRQPQVSEPEITQIIAYIRALQRANGIF